MEISENCQLQIVPCTGVVNNCSACSAPSFWSDHWISLFYVPR